MKLFALTALAALFALPVAAASCGPDADVERLLVEKFGEARQSFGLSTDGELVITWGNPESGTFTITSSTPNGVTCILLDGHLFEIVPPDPKGEDM